jgi:hypothetical protein
MSPGMRVKIHPDLVPYYRKQATAVEGEVVGLSKSGRVAQIHLDDVADSFVRVCDLAAVKR